MYLTAKDTIFLLRKLPQNMPRLENTFNMSCYSYDIISMWIVKSEKVKHYVQSEINVELAII